MKKSVLTFLGRDSGFGEKNNSAYVEIDDDLILIDCGFTVFEQVKSKFDITKYNNIYIIITHLHNDHAGSLSQLILYAYFLYNKKVTVVTKCKKIQEYLEITGTPKESYVCIDKLENLEFIETSHTAYLDAYGFKANLLGKNIIYTGDTNTLEPFMKYLDNTHELYIDVSRFGGAHIKIDNVLEDLRKIKEKNIDIFLMHLDDIEYIKNITNNEFDIN